MCKGAWSTIPCLGRWLNLLSKLPESVQWEHWLRSTQTRPWAIVSWPHFASDEASSELVHSDLTMQNRRRCWRTTGKTAWVPRRSFLAATRDVSFAWWSWSKLGEVQKWIYLYISLSCKMHVDGPLAARLHLHQATVHWCRASTVSKSSSRTSCTYLETEACVSFKKRKAHYAVGSWWR